MSNKIKSQKHVPMRMCMVTKEKKPKNELLRIVNTGNGVKVDMKGKEKGRGANIIMDVEAFDKAIEKNILSRALKLERKLTEEEVKNLRNEFVNSVEERMFRKSNKPVRIRVSKSEVEKLKNGEVKK